ncbi:amidohydrolase [Sesbania bispinosa]|nr:amidohydrolase [Sesbania bispinosa]
MNLISSASRARRVSTHHWRGRRPSHHRLGGTSPHRVAPILFVNGLLIIKAKGIDGVLGSVLDGGEGALQVVEEGFPIGEGDGGEYSADVF